MRTGDRRRFRQDPLEYLDDLRRHSTTGLIPLPWGGWCVSDTELAHTLLRSPEYHTGRSGFFGELLPTRSAQIDVGHAVRDLMRAGVPHYRAAFTAAVVALPATGRWPDAGTRLVHRGLEDLLLHPEAPPRTRKLMREAALGGVAVRAPHVWQRARAEVLRPKLVAALAEEVARRRKDPAAEPRDVLDAVVGACPAGETDDRTAAELHLMMFRAVMAPLSSSLAWAVLLACLRHRTDSPWPWPAGDIVREALRHRPMAWMLGRVLPHAVKLGDIAFEAGDLVSVSPYLLHHDAHHWPDPDAFRPERWAAADARHGPCIPFGAGPFTCAGAAVAHTLLTESLTALSRDAHLTVTGGDTRPAMAEGNVPRPFTLRRTLEPPAAGDTGHDTGGR
ncbi:cytochrome P450 [Streptomyces flavofungini]|uniref:cytochrome P450 n=1 Tax=Streptomyces flavofungini TaxID=68200 RepID=UPI0025B00EE6|nr:cytochrome P450 [Streptomyces flavofungini]WJV44706.1 cytochrome P450 [Streptomyces flavofungini]